MPSAIFATCPTPCICQYPPTKVPGSDPPSYLLWHQEGVCHRQSNVGKLFWHENLALFQYSCDHAEKVRVFAWIDADKVVFAISRMSFLSQRCCQKKTSCCLMISQIVSWQIGPLCRNVGNLWWMCLRDFKVGFSGWFFRSCFTRISSTAHPISLGWIKTQDFTACDLCGQLNIKRRWRKDIEMWFCHETSCHQAM